MFLSVLCFVAGIVTVQQFSELPEIQWVVALVAVAIGFSYFRLWRLMFFTMGLLWAIYYAHIHLADSLTANLEGQKIPIEGQVIGLPNKDDRRVRFDFLVLKSAFQLPQKIKLSWYFPKQEIKSGQRWQFTVKLKKPYGRLNPGGFDYQRWLFAENIGATGYVRSSPKPKLLATLSKWQSYTVLRQAISDQISFLLPDSENIGLIKALTIGDKHEINDRQWEVFRKTGTVHLLAISGLHIGLISGLVFFLVLKLAIKLSVDSPQRTAAISTLLVAIFYAALAGFSVPTQRALIMLLVFMSAIIVQRNIAIKNTLALAMLGVLLFDPLAVLSAGFWLSFLAVSIIAYSLSGRLGKTGYWIGATKTHLVTAIALSPLLILYFQQISIIAPFANFIVVPVVSLVVVPLCFIAVLMMFVSTQLAVLFLQLIDLILSGIGKLLSVMAELPFASITTDSYPLYVILFALLGVFILLAPKGIPARWLGGVLLLPLLFTKQDTLKDAELEMTLLDVGQGLSAVIQTAHHALVFDTGAKYSAQFNMGSSVVIPFLKYKRIQKVDTLLISHGDNDHIGGAQAIIEEINVQRIISSVPKLLEPSKAEFCRAGQQWLWDKVMFQIISPSINGFNSENNNSCVLRVSTENKSILLTGDIEKEAENWLIKHYGSALKSDVLIAPHHGSNTSSTMPFLKAVDPQVILIPAGYRNRFSFPHKKVISRYVNLNKNWLNTAEQGAITVVIDNQQLTVISTRKDKGKYWN